MSIMHCMECHHEWESTSQKSLCDWCGAGGYVLKSKTDLEKMLEMWKKDPETRPANGFPLG